MRQIVLAAVLAVAAIVVAIGVGVVYPPAGVITFGVLLAAWGLVTFGDFA
jgi:hypothetical protein